MGGKVVGPGCFPGIRMTENNVHNVVRTAWSPRTVDKENMVIADAALLVVDTGRGYAILLMAVERLLPFGMEDRRYSRALRWGAWRSRSFECHRRALLWSSLTPEQYRKAVWWG